MINNINFKGYAKISTEFPKETQLNLYKALTKPATMKAIKEQLPPDVEVRFTVNPSDLKYNLKAELYKNDKKLDEMPYGREGKINYNYINDFVAHFAYKSLSKFGIEDKSKQKQNVIKQIKKDDGLII